MKKLKKYNDSKVVDETGNRYGKLVVISRNTDPEKQVDGRAMWNCQCDCGNTCIVAGKSLRTGHVNSCGCKIRSKGEIKIDQLLKQANLNFSQQYTVYIQQDLYQTSQPHPYYFDFAIFNSNNILCYLIEFDGIQHFETKDKFWDSKENFEKTQLRDAIKNQWCKDNNIPLIRIPYTHLKDLCINDLLLETSNFIIK